MIEILVTLRLTERDINVEQKVDEAKLNPKVRSVKLKSEVESDKLNDKQNIYEGRRIEKNRSGKGRERMLDVNKIAHIT